MKKSYNHSASDLMGDNLLKAFLAHRESWKSVQEHKRVVAEMYKDMVSAFKADGFAVNDFKIADALEGTPEQEAKVMAAVEDRLRVASWLGHRLAKQLDLFVPEAHSESYEKTKSEGEN